MKGEVYLLVFVILECLCLLMIGYCSKSWDEFVVFGVLVFDFIFIVCDNVVGEVCLLWFGKLVLVYWGVFDFVVVEGVEE